MTDDEYDALILILMSISFEEKKTKRSVINFELLYFKTLEDAFPFSFNVLLYIVSPLQILFKKKKRKKH